MVFTKNVGMTVRMQWLHSIRGPRKETPSKSPLIFVDCEWQQLGWWVDMYRCIYSIWGVCEDDRWQVQGTLPKRGHAANHRAALRARVDTRAGKIANMSTSLSLISSVASWQSMFQSFVQYQYPSSKNWLIRAEEKLDISATNFLHLSSLRCCQKLHWPQYSIPTATENLEPASTLNPGSPSLGCDWLKFTNINWALEKSFLAGYYWWSAASIDIPQHFPDNLWRCLGRVPLHHIYLATSRTPQKYSDTSSKIFYVNTRAAAVPSAGTILSLDCFSCSESVSREHNSARGLFDMSQVQGVVIVYWRIWNSYQHFQLSLYPFD